MSDSTLRLLGIGALAGLLAGIFIAIPATAVAHAAVLTSYQATPLQIAKSTCCGQVLPDFWSQVLPNLNFGSPLVSALIGLTCGAAFGVLYVIFRKLAPGPTLFKAAIFSVAVALPFVLGLRSPFESAFMFGPPYPLPDSYRLHLALPLVAAGIGIAGLVQILDSQLPHPSQSRILTPIYGSLIAVAGIGLLFLPLITGMIQIGGD